MQRVSIKWKITGLIFFIVFFSLIVFGFVLMNQFISMKENELKERAMLISRTVAELPQVNGQLVSSEIVSDTLNKTIDHIRIINQAEYIVVLNMERVRLTHPIKEMIGTVSMGTDEGPAFAENTYTSNAAGDVGVVLRAFTPVMGKDHEQIGVVITGYVLPSVLEMVVSMKKEILLTVFIVLLFGAWGSWILAGRIRKGMFNLEPHEIARIVVERTEAFNAMHEGVIAIDLEEQITIFNHKAKDMLDVQGDVIGMKIRDVLPDTHLPEILEKKEAIYNKDLHIRGFTILSNRIPIQVKGEVVGAIAIFQDHTEVKQLAEELTGVRAFVSALRVQNHEHMNKLHTIAGLIQLGNKEKALQYVFDVTEEQEELTKFLTENIHHDSLSGLLLSKVSRGKELGIRVTIDRHSYLNKFPPFIDHHDLVLIVGNLIENAYDSFIDMEREENEIYVSIQQTDSYLSIFVEDNGCGIALENISFLLNEGYSTKEEKGRGIGLFLIGEIVAKGNGDIKIDTELEKWTSFSITFPMNGGMKNDSCSLN